MKKEKTKAIIAILNEHSKELDTLNDWSEESHRRIKALDRDIMSLNNKINHKLKDVNYELHGINARLDSIVNGSDELHKRLYHLEQNVTDIQDGSDPKINGLSGRLNKLKRHILTLEADVKTEFSCIKKELKQIWSILQTTDIKLDKLDRHRVKATEAPADSLDTHNSEKHKPQPPQVSRYA